ncbi:MAG: enoyl-CoA hydratase/isomerase family protein [Alphaproteobacteria bacterium]
MQKVTVDVTDSIAVVTIANPPHGYMDDEIVGELERATRQLDARGDVKVIVLTGGLPGVFVQHYNLHELEAMCRKLMARGESFGEHRHIPERRIDVVFRRLEASAKPVIAAINGNAMGGGFEMALACDFRLAQDGDFMLGLPEIRVGMLPGAGGTQRLTRLVGLGKAMELLLHGKRLSPREALAQGMVHEVTDGPVLARAIERARDLAALPAKSLAHVKRLAYTALERPLYDGLDLERALFVDLLASPECVEVMSALNRRNGDFRTL